MFISQSSNRRETFSIGDGSFPQQTQNNICVKPNYQWNDWEISSHTRFVSKDEFTIKRSLNSNALLFSETQFVFAGAVHANLLYSSRQLSTPHIPTVLFRPGAVHQFLLHGGRCLLKVTITGRRDSHKDKTCTRTGKIYRIFLKSVKPGSWE